MKYLHIYIYTQNVKDIFILSILYQQLSRTFLDRKKALDGSHLV